MNPNKIFIFFYEMPHPKYKDDRWSYTIKDYSNNLHIINRKERIKKQEALNELNKTLAGIYNISLDDLICEESCSDGMVFYYTKEWQEWQDSKK